MYGMKKIRIMEHKIIYTMIDTCPVFKERKKKNEFLRTDEHLQI